MPAAVNVRIRGVLGGKTPIAAWRTPYEAMARDERLSWTTLDDVAAAVRAFLDPGLAGGLDAA
ncbi:MAG: hypothetical protein FJ104_14355 [Deltaproteobacteria bacterium]|nr:hypothetical protein [Deltaproteobacteria bacterium]